jgi:hypothetical protein
MLKKIDDIIKLWNSNGLASSHLDALSDAEIIMAMSYCLDNFGSISFPVAFIKECVDALKKRCIPSNTDHF